MITIIAYNPSFGAAYNLRRAFSLWEETRLITLETHPLWAGEEDIILTAENGIDCRRLIEQSRFTMISGAAGLKDMLSLLGGIEWAKKQRWIPFWGDTAYWQNSALYTDLTKEMGVTTTFAMMDIMSRAPGAIPLCHPFDDMDYNPVKPYPLKIMHSPRTENKRKLKGTERIERVIARLLPEFPEMQFSSLVNLPWRDCLSLKREAHIFIDQLPYPGIAAGLGKSGEEALVFGSVVLTALHGQEYLEGYSPPPPVIPVYDEEQLYTELRQLCLMDRGELEAKGMESRRWAEKHLLFEGWLEYVGRWLR